MTVTISKDPIVVFRSWLAQAEKSEPRDPTAMTLATATPDGLPSARMVLLKGVDERGFTFYTNLGSRKARELQANRKAALCFHWKSSNRQVRVEGTVEPVGDAEADAYFASRPRMARVGAWASKQSQPMEGMFELEKRVIEFTAKFNIGEVPRPRFWSGYRVRPVRIEFWEEKQFRLHERVAFDLVDGVWTPRRLFP